MSFVLDNCFSVTLKFWTMLHHVFLVSVDGNWTVWTEWGTCDQSCANGTIMRQRWCVNPRPERGGRYCVGDAIERLPCNDFPCPSMYPFFMLLSL